MCEADGNQLAFSSGEGGSRRLTDEEDGIMLHIIQCVKTKSFVTFLFGHVPVHIPMPCVWGNERIWNPLPTGISDKNAIAL
ncbi:MAG: hypothetical protein ACI3XO_07310 [Eubacteriales bacterium]